MFFLFYLLRAKTNPITGPQRAYALRAIGHHDTTTGDTNIWTVYLYTREPSNEHTRSALLRPHRQTRQGTDSYMMKDVKYLVYSSRREWKAFNQKMLRIVRCHRL